MPRSNGDSLLDFYSSPDEASKVELENLLASLTAQTMRQSCRPPGNDAVAVISASPTAEANCRWR